MADTIKEFDKAMAMCRKVFTDKMGDYGPSWRIMRPESLTDQIMIKARRIRTLQINGFSAVGEDILPEFIAIVNYGIISIIQLKNGFAECKDMSAAEALEMYDRTADETKKLMLAKNHDYGEAWRSMRVSSFTDIILMKVERTKEIEDHKGKTAVSEGVESNYLDMINYAVFAIIKLTDGEN